jgi:hypothetical protein
LRTPSNLKKYACYNPILSLHYVRGSKGGYELRAIGNHLILSLWGPDGEHNDLKVEVKDWNDVKLFIHCEKEKSDYYYIGLVTEHSSAWTRARLVDNPNSELLGLGYSLYDPNRKTEELYFHEISFWVRENSIFEMENKIFHQ